MKKKSILFVCTANLYRSPFAAAVFRNLLRLNNAADAWRVGSAGTWTQPGLSAAPQALDKAQAYGVDLRTHASVEVGRDLLLSYMLIVVMESGHKEALCIEFPDVRERIFLLSEIVDDIVYDIPDPAKNPDDGDEIIHALYELILRGYMKICRLVDTLEQ